MSERLVARWAASGLVLSCLLVRSLDAHAQGEPQTSPITRRECLSAAEATQALRDQGKLRAARAQSLVCSRPECPSPLRRDCSGFLLQIDDSMPTVVFRAVDADGKDIAGVRVDMDGTPLIPVIEGRAVPVDPGPHRFVFTSAGRPSHAENVMIAQGEKNRRVVIQLTAAITPPAVSAKDQHPPATTEPPSSDAGRGPLFWTAAVTGVVGLGGLTFFGISALSKRHELETSCAPRNACTEDDHNALRTRAIIADVSGGVMIVSAAVVVWLALRSPPGHPTTSRAALPRLWSFEF